MKACRVVTIRTNKYACFTIGKHDNKDIMFGLPFVVLPRKRSPTCAVLLVTLKRRWASWVRDLGTCAILELLRDRGWARSAHLQIMKLYLQNTMHGRLFLATDVRSSPISGLTRRTRSFSVTNVVILHLRVDSSNSRRPYVVAANSLCNAIRNHVLVVSPGIDWA